jgi:hypothetical protein
MRSPFCSPKRDHRHGNCGRPRYNRTRQRSPRRPDTDVARRVCQNEQDGDMPDQMDPLAEATGRVVIAAGRMDGAVGVLVGYALGDRSGRIMPGSLDALIRWWADHIDRETDVETRSRHRAARNEAIQLGLERDELIHGLWTRAADQVAQSNRIPTRAAELALGQHTISELRQLADKIDAHADTILALAAEIMRGEQR